MCVAIPGDIAAINTNVQVGTKGGNATILPVVNGDAWRPHKLKVSFSERRIEITYKVSLRKWENMHRKPYRPEVFTICPVIARKGANYTTTQDCLMVSTLHDGANTLSA